MRYLSLFSGIGGCTAAVERLGLPWHAAAYAEVDPAASAVLAYRWPGTPNVGDVRAVDWRPFRGSVDIIVGGPPCQDFSVAGKQAGSAGARGAMLGEFLRAVQEIKPKWAILENVPGLLATGPGLLSTGRGRDFGTLLGRLGKLGFGAIAWRILDSRHFGTCQRRRRLFLVGHRSDGRGPERVLDLPEGGRRHPPESRSEGEEGSPPAAGGPPGSELDGLTGWRRPPKRRNTDGDPTALAADFRHATLGKVAPTLTRGAVGVSLNAVPGVIQLLHADTHNVRVGGIAQTLRSDMDGSASHQGCALYQDRGRWVARRLTPIECLRLQGYDDEWLDGARLHGKPLADLHRYKLIGNAWSVPVAAWVLERLAAVDAIASRRSASETRRGPGATAGPGQ